MGTEAGAQCECRPKRGRKLAGRVSAAQPKTVETDENFPSNTVIGAYVGGFPG